MAEYLYLIPLLPLAASIINLLFARKAFPDKAHLVATAGVIASFVLSVLVFKEIYDDEHALHQTISTWIESGSFSTSLSVCMSTS
ncbi:MAG: hypothetical protein R2839_00400 [Thermomicrobiales bacterium]